MKHLFFTSLAATIVCLSAAAQPPQDGNVPPQGFGQFPEGEQRPMVEPAQMKADRMKEELNLTDKQYKKVLKVFKAEQSAMHPSNESMGGPGGGMGGPGMGQGGRPQGPPPGMTQLSDEEMEKIISKKEKKLRKILSAEQFDQWAKNHPEEFTIVKELDWNLQ